ncbi:MAG TPA: LysR family transcriptional regulator [Planctomycetaceae bacterium]|nr:LysR family transcriptional regulator [Planctomycetaceae bacterium]
MPRTVASRQKPSPDAVATLAELQCYRDIVEVLRRGGWKSLNQVWDEVSWSPSYCKMTLERLRGPERWNRRLINGNTLKLTDDGDRAYDYARRVLDAHAAGPFVTRREVLRIGTTNRVMTAFLGPKVRDFLLQHRGRPKHNTTDPKPIDVDLELRESSLDEILWSLRREEIEIAIGGVPVDGMPKDLDHFSIDGRLETVLIAAKGGCGDYTRARLNEGRKVEWTELANADICIIRSDLHGVLGHLPRPAPNCTRIVVDNYASVASVVKSGAAVGLVLDMGLPDDVLKFELGIKSRPPARELAVWTRRGEKLSATAQAFINAVTMR